MLWKRGVSIQRRTLNYLQEITALRTRVPQQGAEVSAARSEDELMCVVGGHCLALPYCSPFRCSGGEEDASPSPPLLGPELTGQGEARVQHL